MPRRVWAAVALPMGLAACDRDVAVPEPPPVVAASPGARLHLSPERRLALNTAVLDARLRLLPSIGHPADGPSPLAAALDGLEAGLRGDDSEALVAAIAVAEGALSNLAANDEALTAEADAIRLLLAELRESAGRDAKAVLED